MMHLAASSRNHSAKTLNAHLAHFNDENIPPTPYPHYPSSPFLSTSSSPLPISSSPNTAPPSPPNTFSTPISPPPPMYPRLEPHTPTLSSLDKIYLGNEHPILDGCRMIGAGGVGNPWDEEKRETKGVHGKNGREVQVEVDVEEMRTKDAMRVLENHIRDRMPFAQVASRRMQAVMGVRNEIVFDLPEIRKSSGYGFSKGTESNGLDAGHAALAAARNNHLAPPPKPKPKRSNSLAFSPHSPLNTPQVDPETGKGLREWLLSKGKEFGVRKRVCRSISFHDFTPEMRNNSWSNKLLGHFAVKEGGKERVDWYEVDLPTMTLDPSTGHQTITTQTWLWFLISRPVLSIDATNTSTRPTSSLNNSPSHSHSLQGTPTTYYSTATRPASSPTPTPNSPLHPLHENPHPPPNFTHPTPTSWLIFACPLENATSYPESIETFNPNPQTDPRLPSRPKPNLPFANPNRYAKKVYKRKDWDLTQNGLPIFEFNSSFLFNGSQPSFLSVEGIGPWYEDDEYAELSEAEYRTRVEEFFENGRDGDGDGDGEMRKGRPSPYQGVWWREFYRGIGEDARRWEGIRGAMGRGKCRVVVRFSEWVPGPSSLGEDVEMGEDGSLEAASFPGSSVGSGGIGNGKIKERLVGRQGRLTRSEARRRSGLGVESMNGVAIGIGSGLGESARSRAVGNRDLGRRRRGVGRSEMNGDALKG